MNCNERIRQKLDPAVIGIQESGISGKTLIDKMLEVLSSPCRSPTGKELWIQEYLHQNQLEAFGSSMFDITRQNHLCQQNPRRVRQELLA